MVTRFPKQGDHSTHKLFEMFYKCHAITSGGVGDLKINLNFLPHAGLVSDQRYALMKAFDIIIGEHYRKHKAAMESK